MSVLASPLGIHFIVALGALYPLTRILARAGLARWSALAVFVPIVGFAIVGSVLAFRPWPNVAPRRPVKK